MRFLLTFVVALGVLLLVWVVFYVLGLPRDPWLPLLTLLIVGGAIVYAVVSGLTRATGWIRRLLAARRHRRELNAQMARAPSRSGDLQTFLSKLRRDEPGPWWLVLTEHRDECLRALKSVGFVDRTPRIPGSVRPACDVLGLGRLVLLVPHGPELLNDESVAEAFGIALAQARGHRRALSGVLAVVPCGESGALEGRPKELGHRIVRAMDLVTKTLWSVLPLVTLVTRCERIPGLLDLVAGDLATPGNAGRLWGVSFPPPKQVDGELEGKDLRAALERLEDGTQGRLFRALRRVQASNDDPDRLHLLDISRRFREMVDWLHDFHVLPTLMRRSDKRDNAHVVFGQAIFLSARRLERTSLGDVPCPDLFLAALPKWLSQHNSAALPLSWLGPAARARFQRLTITGSIVSLGLAVYLGWAGQSVLERTEALAELSRADATALVRSDGHPTPFTELADVLGPRDQLTPSWLAAQLYSWEEAVNRAQLGHARAFQDAQLLPLVERQGEVVGELPERTDAHEPQPTSYGEVYDALALVGLLGGRAPAGTMARRDAPERFERAFIAAWSRAHPEPRPGERDAALKHWRLFFRTLQALEEHGPLEEGSVLVVPTPSWLEGAQQRMRAWRGPDDHLRTLRARSERTFCGWDVDGTCDPAAQQAREDLLGEARDVLEMTEYPDVFHTRVVWETLVGSALTSSSATSEEAWVLAADSDSRLEQELQAYWHAYEEAWSAQLERATVVCGPTSLNASHQRQPVRRLLEWVAYETGAPTSADDAAEQPAITWVQSFFRWMVDGFSQLDTEEAALRRETMPPLPAFARLHTFLAGAGGHLLDQYEASIAALAANPGADDSRRSALELAQRVRRRLQGTEAQDAIANSVFLLMLDPLCCACSTVPRSESAWQDSWKDLYRELRTTYPGNPRATRDLTASNFHLLFGADGDLLNAPPEVRSNVRWAPRLLAASRVHGQWYQGEEIELTVRLRLRFASETPERPAAMLRLGQQTVAATDSAATLVTWRPAQDAGRGVELTIGERSVHSFTGHWALLHFLEAIGAQRVRRASSSGAIKLDIVDGQVRLELHIERVGTRDPLFRETNGRIRWLGELRHELAGTRVPPGTDARYCQRAEPQEDP